MGFNILRITRLIGNKVVSEEVNNVPVPVTEEQNKIIKKTKILKETKSFKFTTILSGLLKAAGIVGTNDEERNLAKQRLAICAPCEHVIPGVISNATNTVGDIIANVIGKDSLADELLEGLDIELKYAKCKKCGCGLVAKTIKPQESCPLNKW